MHILVLSQYYKPEPIPKPVELAQALRCRGHDVTVITGFPNYPAGKLYQGYRLRPMKREILDGIPVIRTYEYPYHGTRTFGRVLNYCSFMISAVLGSFFVRKLDAIYVWHPPLTIGVTAWIIARLRGIPFVYDVQDIWPESAILSGMLKPGRLVNCIAALERFVYRRASHILVVTEGAKNNLTSKSIDPRKISAMPHWINEKLFVSNDPQTCSQTRRQLAWEGRFVVLFAGNMGLVQGLDTVIRAAEILRSVPKILFVFIGDGSDKDRVASLATSLGLAETVRFVDRQPMDRMPAYMSAADLLLVHLKHSELSNYIIPTKTMAYLASGRPIVMAMTGAAADLVRAARGGITVPPENPSQLASAVQSLSTMSDDDLSAMGKSGQEYLLANFSKDKVISQYEALITQMLEQKVNERPDGMVVEGKDSV